MPLTCSCAKEDVARLQQQLQLAAVRLEKAVASKVGVDASAPCHAASAS
jgi:hypothetical protein